MADELLASTAAEPVYSAGATFVWWSVLVLVAALTVVALVRLARRSESSSGLRLLWLVVIVLIPVIGPGLYLATHVGQAKADARRNHVGTRQ